LQALTPIEYGCVLREKGHELDKRDKPASNLPEDENETVEKRRSRLNEA
jgi:hypothetical protein